MEEKLSELFRRTFLSLPSDVRESLNFYWSKLGLTSEDGNHWPALVIKRTLFQNSLVERYPPPERGPIESLTAFALRQVGHYWSHRNDPVVRAQCIGDVFLFRTDIVKDAPDDVLQTIIAEELAHAFQAAPTGKRYPAAAEGKDAVQLETEAKALALRWGFDTKRATEWCAHRYGR